MHETLAVMGSEHMTPKKLKLRASAFDRELSASAGGVRAGPTVLTNPFCITTQLEGKNKKEAMCQGGGYGACSQRVCHSITSDPQHQAAGGVKEKIEFGDP
ncbi:hypothetical protein NDU88_005819 [Pleurodeles waltl]|uniref:Uncharacterized protein n=1 Tax=Pleurodeles waltl TaxID=8319 RepID=A0AAV7MXG0_PLEWA|nr:hypothetical protein NDU88_005819 [Pleurodeles waltl]